MTLIEVSGLRKVFTSQAEPVEALRDISLTIEPGEFVAITGPSGSGKSTLLYVLGLLDTQTAGTYSLRGQRVERITDRERSQIRNQLFGFVFQSFHLLPRASALRNVSLPLQYGFQGREKVGRTEMFDRSQAALRAVALEERATHRPNELSGGQRQRVAIARALVNKPQVIFADEPTGNLDSKHGEEIIRLFQDLNRAGTTIVMVTHDHEIAGQAGREIKMLDGKIVGKDSDVMG